MLQRPAYFLIVLLLLTTASCGKRVAVAPPPPPLQPEAPAPPVPVISLAADRTAIDEGQSATLEWKTENASAVRISELGDVDLNGSVQVTPRAATTYTATAIGAGGTASDTVRITVAALARQPERDVPPSASVLSLDEDFRNNIQDVYFDYDRSNLRPDQLPKVEALVRWLARQPDAAIIIEGHGDERGSAEYNLGLGDLRASTIRAFLAREGISTERLQIISYGEERPICTEQGESCWSRNRRTHSVLETP